VSMRGDAMVPYGLALRAYADGASGAEFTIRRDDGVEDPMPVSHYFRDVSDLNEIESTALQRCHGRVLDVGGGTGVHSLVLQSRGLSVTAIDVDPNAVEIMAQRGVADAKLADVFDYTGGPFDTVILLEHGIGIVGDLRGLADFLAHAHSLICDSGQLLVDSMDVSRTSDPVHLAYHELLRRTGRYIGEIRIQIQFGDAVSRFFGWLHVDPQTLERCAGDAGWGVETLCEDESGNYLARMTRRRPSN